MSTIAIYTLGRKTIQTASCNTIASDTTTASADTSLDCFEDLRWLNRLPPDWD